MKKSIISFIHLLLILCFPWVLSAQGEAATASESPYFQILNEDAAPAHFPLKSTNARVHIAGIIADVVITQEYENKGDAPIEAVYVFPASTRAAVYAMQMQIGERVIRAEIREREAARAAYQQAKEEGRSASLLEQHKPNVFQMNVANILPGDVIRVELRYTEYLLPEAGTYTFLFPTVVGPRFSDGSTQEPGGNAWLENPYTSEGVAPLYDFDIEVDIEAPMPIRDLRCTSHKIETDWKENKRVSVALAAGESKGGNRDFILEYRLRGKELQSGVLFSSTGKEQFFMAMIQPPERVEAAHIPPREYVFIVDVSGSMNGFPLDVSKALITKLLDGLRPQDRFNILFFASSNASFAPASVPATFENRGEALKMLNTYSGGGGTQLLPALETALKMPATADVARSFVIITDGYVHVESQAFDLIRKNLGTANFFTFGIGSSVNHFLLEGMARVGKGETFLVTGSGEAKEKADRFRKYVEAPVLSRVEIAFEGLDAYDVEPADLHDVFSDRPVMVVGKYRGEARGSIILKGHSGAGKYKQELKIDQLRKGESDNAALKYLWARERIRWMDDYALAGFALPGHKEQILGLALEYNLLTRFTSFIAIDSEVRNAGGQQQTVVQPLPLPQGVSDAATANIVTVQGVNASYAPKSGSEKIIRTNSLMLEDVALDVVSEAEVFFNIVEAMPTFPGGEDALQRFVRQHFIYPDFLKMSGLNGEVRLHFFVEADGSLSGLKVVQALHPEIDKAVMDALRQSSGQWQPGRQGSKAVRAAYTFVFRLLR